MRRGGDDYFALDISNYQKPRFEYMIDGGVGDFEELGQSWSQPIKTRIWIGDKQTDVLIFAAGYDTNQDPAADSASYTAKNRTMDSIGRGIFIVDALTGAKLWQSNRNEFSDLNYSIPSDIKVVDINFDGIADQLYVGDTGGQVWRFDINNAGDKSAPLTQRITGDVVAQFGADDGYNARKFFYLPDVSVLDIGQTKQLAISLGSGWRAHPLNQSIADRFYSFRLSNVFAAPIDENDRVSYPEPIEEDDLVDVTLTVGSEIGSNKSGWMYRLDATGEKVLASSVTLNNQVLFTSYSPAQTVSGCSAAVGSGAFYALNLRNGDPAIEFDENDNVAPDDANEPPERKKQLLQSGIPPNPTVLFPELGAATVVVGTEPVPETDLGALKRSTFWVEAAEE